MPKLKSNRSASARFTVTASGIIKRGFAGVRHNLRKKTKKQIRKKRGTTALSDNDRSLVKRLCPYLIK